MTELPPIEAVLAAERARAAAVMARDLDALRGCLHDALVYVHATGTRHDKAGLLAYVESGPQFIVVGFDVQQEHHTGHAVLLHGELRLRLRRPGESEIVAAHSWASAAWLRDADGRWKLRLFQSTRCAV